MDTDRVEGAARKVGGKIESAFGDLAGDTKLQGDGLVDQALGTVQNVAGQARDTLRDVAGQAGGIAQDALARGRDALPDSANQAYRDGRAMVSDQVRESPLNALLIAGAVGYAIAWLVHGRK